MRTSRVTATSFKQFLEWNAASLCNSRQIFESMQKSKRLAQNIAIECSYSCAALVSHHENRMLESQFCKRVVHLSVIQNILAGLAANHLIERGLCDKNPSLPNKFVHLTEEESQKQCANMASVDIGVCHDDDTAISKLRRVKVCADATLERLNKRLDFLERKHLIKPALFNIQ